MTHTYHITGMTCFSCSVKVEGILSSVPGVTKAKVDLDSQMAEITMEDHIKTSVFKDALKGTKYFIVEENTQKSVSNPDEPVEPISFKVYLPVLLIFSYITGITLIIQFQNQSFNMSQWMAHFMAGFFLTFSFFKLLDVPAFASSYSTYDILAKRIYGYGYLYPFLELALGLSFLVPELSFYSHLCTFILMSVSIIGVIQSMLRKSKFQCACLGAVFKLPLSKITLFEDALMIAMSIIALLSFI